MEATQNDTPGQADTVIEFTIASHYRFVEMVGSVADQLTQLAGFEAENIDWVGLAVRESVVNAIKHGNQLDASKPVEVRFHLTDEKLLVVVRDRGNGFDASHVADPRAPENLLNPNGRGIFYMRTFMDDVEFLSHRQGGLEVRMTKRRPPRNGGC
ncbi:MAG: ATP-binding protein [Chloracidobacterium sp. CP2_5A]|nr:MAG: ATP-binding protein [Chloracidobacterium sp. CP2_5A]